MPYLDGGSIGIGMVLDEYLRRRPDEQFATAASGVGRTAQSPMYILPGLFSGRAGVLPTWPGAPTTPRPTRTWLGRSATSPGTRCPSATGMAFPGTGLLRLSMDLATGTAGVLLALGAACTTGRCTPRCSLRPAVRSRAGEPPQTPTPAGVGQ